MLVWLGEVETQPSLVLSLLALATLSHLAASVLLYLGVRLARREFLLPWLVTHMVIVIIMTTIFTVWTFITFFIDLLVSVVFPVLSGLVLGLSILAWRLVLAAYRNHLVRSVKSALYTLYSVILTSSADAAGRKFYISSLGFGRQTEYDAFNFGLI